MKSIMRRKSLLIFAKNQIIKINIEKEVTERILWIDSDYSLCFTIDINDKKALPMKRNILSLTELLKEDRLEIMTDEPYRIYFTESELSVDQKEKRNNRWELIKGMASVEPDIYIDYKRGKLIKALIGKKTSKKKYIYQYLRLYWQRGMHLNALLADYSRCGLRGETKNLGGKKVGRPRLYKDNPGMNVTEEVKQVFLIGINRYKPSNKRTLKDCFEQIKRDFFAQGERYENGRKITIIKEDAPSLEQFRYWYNQNVDPEKRNITKKGRTRHLLEDRPVLDISDSKSRGPGWRYQIDATVADVYLVSEKNPNWIIGRPVVYIVMDVYSRMVAGMYVGLEGPSYLGALMALVNTASDKVKFCKEYGIDITEDMWPVKHFPDKLLADRGELKGPKVEQLIESFGVRMENTPPYRADWKGIVEQYFRLLNLKVKPLVPGAVTKEKLRGERNYALDAILTLTDFRKILINAIIHHNNYNWLSNYKPDDEMLKNEVPLYPVDLWNWGIKNDSGRLKFFQEDFVKLRLLPRKENVSVTEYGIHFERGLQYSCERAIKEQWFQEAALKGSWKITVAYDPRCIKYIYILNKDGSYEVCKLLGYLRQYEELQYDDFVFIRKMQKRLEEKEELKRRSEKVIDYVNEIESIKEAAEERSKEAEKISDSQKLKNIDENRKNERNEIRTQEAFILDKAKEEIKKDITQQATNEEIVKGKASKDLLKLMELQKEMGMERKINGR
ncbi:DNA-binding protein [Bacillus timonensis]|uniref:DNA-binding protein n=1 Tax=Bacillus timonensis TaxID=1033734 RepID=A0A4S3PUX4_9BACI|nr:DNA-binding protein [Bacillus timonensis]